MKQRTIEGFGTRLAEARRSRGLTQTQLGDAVGVSKRVIVYYEQDDAQPPGALLAALARTLEVSADQLLGLDAPPSRTPPRHARLRKRLAAVERLPVPDQRAVLRFIDALATSRGIEFK